MYNTKIIGYVFNFFSKTIPPINIWECNMNSKLVYVYCIKKRILVYEHFLVQIDIN